MPDLDRARIAALLGRLGADDDRTVLDAARELHRTVTEADTTWEALLCPPLATETEDISSHEPQAAAPETTTEASGELSSEDKAEAERLIDRLLARDTISNTLRDDLTDLKRGIADGSFDRTDQRYVHALAKRLGA